MAAKTRKLVVCVIGLGQIGGSIARALARHPRYRVIGADADAAALRKFKAVGGRVLPLPSALPAADVVVVAVPVRSIAILLPVVARLARNARLVLDVGGAKQAVRRAAQRLPELPWIGGHPLCGTERSGFEASDPALFRGKTFTLSPRGDGAKARSPRERAAARTAERLARDLGALPLWADARSHDRIVALMSHLPHLIALALADGGMRAHRARRDLPRWVGGSFRGATRVAASPPEMASQMLLANPELPRAARDFQKTLRTLLAEIRRQDTARLAKRFAAWRRSPLSRPAP